MSMFNRAARVCRDIRHTIDPAKTDTENLEAIKKKLDEIEKLSSEGWY